MTFSVTERSAPCAVREHCEFPGLPRTRRPRRSGRPPSPRDHASPTSGDNSVDCRAKTGGRMAVDRWTTGVHPGDSSVGRRPVHRSARPPTVGPEAGHTGRHTAGPATTGSIHTIHRCEYYCCCSLLEELQEEQPCGPSRPWPLGRGRRTGMTPGLDRLYGGPPDVDPSRSTVLVPIPVAAAPATRPPVPARERCPS